MITAQVAVKNHFNIITCCDGSVKGLTSDRGHRPVLFCKQLFISEIPKF